MTPVEAALARAESLSGVPNEGDFALLAKEIRRLQDLLPHFARHPSFAAWVEDARVTADEVKRLKATLSDQAAVLRGVLDENERLRAR